ncbi:MAG: SPOR domain-containing protein [Desulfobacteraceae bacterium]|nr:SPOR domain-containing protein [Desulfobacteraceae bacterium]
MTIRTVTFQASTLLVLLLCGTVQGFCEEDRFRQGLALIKARQYDKAIEAFSEAIDMIPVDAEAYNYRAIARVYQKDYDGAILDYTMALKIKPEYAEALNNRGYAWVKKGNLEKALADFSRAIELDPYFLDAHNSKAWILATSSDMRYRNGKQAVSLAKKAMAIAKTVDSLDTMSAAYAANGQFDEAIASQKKVIELVVRQNRADEMDSYLEHLVNYKAHKPLRISYGTAKTSENETTVAKPPGIDPKANKKPAAQPQIPADNLGPLPYTIQVSAYRDPQKSIDVATKLKDNGDPAFTCPVLIPGKGEWHRVYIGFYKSLDEAQKAADLLKKRKFHFTEIAKKPLAVQVGLADSYKDAREFKSRLREKGYMAYSLLDRKGLKKTRILIGAYGSKEEAMQLMEKLQKDGFTTEVLPR